MATLNEAGVQRMGGFRFLKGNRLRGVLVIVEVALSTVLLAGGALLVRSFIRLIDVNPGYDPANVITAQVGLPETRYRYTRPRRARSSTSSCSALKRFQGSGRPARRRCCLCFPAT